MGYATRLQSVSHRNRFPANNRTIVLYKVQAVWRKDYLKNSAYHTMLCMSDVPQKFFERTIAKLACEIDDIGVGAVGHLLQFVLCERTQ